MSDETITRISLANRRRGRTDWARVDAKTDAEIEADMRADPDWDGTLDIDWSSAEVFVPPAKTAISIRLDADVLAFFKAQGPGYQRRINAVLRHYMTKTAKAPSD